MSTSENTPNLQCDVVPIVQGPSWSEAVSMRASGYDAYKERARAVYWHDAPDACRASGPQHADCVLVKGHPGPHYGNGFDDYGPRGPVAWSTKDEGDTDA